MIFRQLFDSVSGTYTYLIASRRGGEALIIDPVLEKVDRYLQLINELDLRLVKAVDTHLHADHITGLGVLRDRTQCVTVMGEETKADVVSRLPDETLVFPAHDYKGDTVSTIGEEKAFNPRLQVKSVDQYVDLMASLKLANPKMMDVAVPANMRVGLAQEDVALRGWAVPAATVTGARAASRAARRRLGKHWSSRAQTPRRSGRPSSALSRRSVIRASRRASQS